MNIDKKANEYWKSLTRPLGSKQDLTETAYAVGSNTLSICCKKSVTLTNTTNDIKCYKCNECSKLTGIEDEYGRRLN